ncbi:MAG: hypothetical protein QM706_02625 [Nitrospira sp.]
MRGFSAHELLDIWDQGQPLLPCRRAMLLLASACPEYSCERIDSLSIGQRDALLAQIRTSTFGSDVMSVVNCPACGEMIEVCADVRSLFHGSPREDSSGEQLRPPLRIEAGEFLVHAALPTVQDLEAIATAVTLTEGHRILWQRCILYTERHGEVCAADELPEDVCALIDSRMAEADPLGNVQLALECPGCRHRWAVLFDILSFFWSEIHLVARRLLEEVHALASAYGWTESEILTLSPTRREAYLEMVGR